MVASLVLLKTDSMLTYSHALVNEVSNDKFCRINYFIKVTLSVHGKPEHAWVANVNVYIADEFRWWLGKPSEV